jgi:hypothetical protein
MESRQILEWGMFVKGSVSVVCTKQRSLRDAPPTTATRGLLM